MLFIYKLIKSYVGKILMSSIENVGIIFKLVFFIKSWKYNYCIFKKVDVIDLLFVIEGNLEELVKEIKNKLVKIYVVFILIVEDNMELCIFLLYILLEDYYVFDVGNG